MNFVKFSIHNYKSIVDSGECYLSDKLTILAGKNESGKTSILEALADCDEERDICNTAKAMDGNGDPYIDLYFRMSKSELNELFKKANLEKSASEETIIGIRKQAGGKNYELIDCGGIQFVAAKSWKEIVPNINAMLDDIDENIDIAELKKQVPEDYLTCLSNALTKQTITVNGNRYTIPTEDDAKKINAVISLINDHISNPSQSDSFLSAFTSRYLPYFILFSSFDDFFPDSIKVTELKSNPWAKDLQVVSNFNIDKISASDKQDQINHQQHVNTEFTDRFKAYWTQDMITLFVNKDGDTVHFWISENGVLYKPSQRSELPQIVRTD